MTGQILTTWKVTKNIVTDSGVVLLEGTNLLINENSRQSLLYNLNGEFIGYINGYPFDYIDKKCFERVK